MSDIKGYRELSRTELAQINAIKDLEGQVIEFIDGIHAASPNPRMFAIAKTNIEQGFMWLIKAIAKPE